MQEAVGLAQLFRTLSFTQKLPRVCHIPLERRTIGIEFSSPNLAKPFHVGHLRSTFLGRFLSNILSEYECEVIRINYIGDFGTQFGLLASETVKEHLTDVTIHDLYCNYVKANQRAVVEPLAASTANEFCRQLEAGHEGTVDHWMKLRTHGVEYLKRIYQDLDVKFDVWQAESDFVGQSHKFIEENLSRNILCRTHDNLIGYKVETTSGNLRYNTALAEKTYKIIPLAKSDSTTLYLTRDVVAAIHRADEMKLDKILYIVDAGQTSHFENLKVVLDAVGRSDVAEKINHVKFGKIRDMSTRKGKSVFVEDMLQLGTDIASEILRTTQTTKSYPKSFPKIARQMALSAFLINDFKRKRTSDYSYDWEKILKPKHNGGYLLQACHARLCSLEETFLTDERNNYLLSLNDQLLSVHLSEPHALALIECLTKGSFEALGDSINNLDASFLVDYLFELAHCANAAHKKLKIAGSNEDLASCRLLLFSSARRVLSYCITLLGLQPLNKL